jgi:hypothetical protein
MGISPDEARELEQKAVSKLRKGMALATRKLLGE